jgi:hypothetical protein
MTHFAQGQPDESTELSVTYSAPTEGAVESRQFPSVRVVVSGTDCYPASQIRRPEVVSIDLTRLLPAERSPTEQVGEWLVGLINEINKLLKARQFNLLNAVLAEFDPQSTDPEATLVFLRTTFPVRRQLSSWPRLRDRAREAFHRRGLDTASLLRGIA